MAVPIVDTCCCCCWFPHWEWIILMKSLNKMLMITINLSRQLQCIRSVEKNDEKSKNKRHRNVDPSWCITLDEWQRIEKQVSKRIPPHNVEAYFQTELSRSYPTTFYRLNFPTTIYRHHLAPEFAAKCRLQLRPAPSLPPSTTRSM